MEAGLLIAATAAATLGSGGLGLALFTAYTARRVEADLPPEGRFVDVDGARIHYLERGAGPTLLLIHGLAGNARHYTHSLVDRLADGFRVVVMERPGSGYSVRQPGTPAGIRRDADAVAAFIRALGLDRPVLVGHSLGGAIALATAVAHPELVAGLALVAPLTQPETEPPPVFRPMMIRNPLLRRLIAWTVAAPIAIRTRETTLATVFDPEPVPADYGTAGGGLLTLRPAGFVAASSDLVAVPRDMPWLAERYAELSGPLAILYGKDDRILDPRRHGAGMAERVPACRLELVEGGHMLPLTQPDRVAAFVRSLALAVDGEPA